MVESNAAVLSVGYVHTHGSMETAGMSVEGTQAHPFKARADVCTRMQMILVDCCEYE